MSLVIEMKIKFFSIIINFNRIHSLTYSLTLTLSMLFSLFIDSFLELEKNSFYFI